MLSHRWYVFFVVSLEDLLCINMSYMEYFLQYVFLEDKCNVPFFSVIYIFRFSSFY